MNPALVHGLQVDTAEESAGRAAAAAGDGSYTAVLRRPNAPTSNGRLTQSQLNNNGDYKRSSSAAGEQRRSRLQAASATPRSADLNAVGVLDVPRDDVQTLLLHMNGAEQSTSTCVEKETTC